MTLYIGNSKLSSTSLFQQMVLGQLDIHMPKILPGSKLHTILKLLPNKLHTLNIRWKSEIQKQKKLDVLSS